MIAPDVLIPTGQLLHNQRHPYANYDSGVYLMVYALLGICGWICAYDETFVDSVVGNIIAVVNEATAEAIPISYPRTNKFIHWYVEILYQKEKLFV
jgi:hypothetical protein